MWWCLTRKVKLRGGCFVCWCLLQEYSSAQTSLAPPPRDKPRCLEGSARDIYKVNFDGSVRNKQKIAGVGVVVRNYKGEVIASMTEQIPFTLDVDSEWLLSMGFSLPRSWVYWIIKSKGIRQTSSMVRSLWSVCYHLLGISSKQLGTAYGIFFLLLFLMFLGWGIMWLIVYLGLLVTTSLWEYGIWMEDVLPSLSSWVSLEAEI